MIEVDGFRGGGCDFNNTTKRDTPFPNSSSTPVSIHKICDDPNDPNYWKENITTQKASGIKVPINQPGIPLTEFAERLIALEKENEDLKIVISLMWAIATRYQDKLAASDAWDIIKKFIHDKGVPNVQFDLKIDHMEYKIIEEENNNGSADCNVD